MVTFRVHRNISVTARVITGLASVASLAFFIFILFKVLTGDFRAGQTTYSVLPVVAVSSVNPSLAILISSKALLIVSKVSYAILWNATALVTIFHFKFGRYFYPVGDTIAFVALAALGGIGVGHDIATYLSNNGNTYYSGYGDFAWLRQTIIGASLALCAV